MQITATQAILPLPWQGPTLWDILIRTSRTQGTVNVLTDPALDLHAFIKWLHLMNWSKLWPSAAASPLSVPVGEFLS